MEGADLAARAELDVGDCVTTQLQIIQGNHEDLLRFLKASAMWLAQLPDSAPASKQEFLTFLEGGFEAIPLQKFGSLEACLAKKVQGSGPTSSKIAREHAMSVEAVRRQAVAFENFIAKNDIQDAELLGAVTDAGAWVNCHLGAFIDAAVDATDLRRGLYQETWPWIRNFYATGQSYE
mmetsp:Transcript_121784/g.279069  ORF Transcript_121784/g.279069 Transcript_121784/m.279069 type:complete len:178 (-) Transcript_121784:125-658(-)